MSQHRTTFFNQPGPAKAWLGAGPPGLRTGFGFEACAGGTSAAKADARERGHQRAATLMIAPGCGSAGQEPNRKPVAVRRSLAPLNTAALQQPWRDPLAIAVSLNLRRYP
jgi:hypothetical protein